MITVYGIANCDSVKKARRFLKAAGIDYVFHDFRKDGIDQELVNALIESISLDQLVNKRSSSWRNLSNEDKCNLQNGHTSLLLSHPTLIKRPVITTKTTTIVGFNQPVWIHWPDHPSIG